jgi:hypothetical protein
MRERSVRSSERTRLPSPAPQAHILGRNICLGNYLCGRLRSIDGERRDGGSRPSRYTVATSFLRRRRDPLLLRARQIASRFECRYCCGSDTGQADRKVNVTQDRSNGTHRAERQVVGGSVVDGHKRPGEASSDAGENLPDFRPRQPDQI